MSEARNGRLPHLGVSLMIMQQGGNGFYLTGGQGSRKLPQVLVTSHQLRRTDLRTSIVDAARSQLHLDISYLGVIAAEEMSSDSALLVAASANTVEGQAGGQHLTAYRINEIAHMVGTLPSAELFEDALGRRSAEMAAGNLGVTIKRAINSSIDHLDAHVSTENGLKGWDQYQDGSRIGVISTAQALLAHVHAGSREDVVEEAAKTLEALQNPDGGWQVRRALVGGTSNASITESTAYCLMALRAAGRTDTAQAVQKGLSWLQDMQRQDGGWSSSANSETSHVVATSLATRVLLAFKRTEAGRRGADWLRACQNVDGGWGPVAQSNGEAVVDSNSSPAYTAHSVLALRATGLDTGDRLIVKACGFLSSAFDPEREEPWASTSYTTLVDPDSFARLDFRHFATPWVLAALSAVGLDLSDKTVLSGTLQLLRMQRADGAWRSGLTAPEAFPVWACHDALFALNSVLITSAERLDSIVLTNYMTKEREAFEETLAQLIYSRSGNRGNSRGYFHTAWMSLLTVLVTFLALTQFDVIETSSGDSKIIQIGKWTIAAFVAAIGALAPPIISEEYKLWRQRQLSPDQVGENP
ncbi:prenyltransferase/squalene oxidase repeat-containing protein [Streptomyces sp. NPDC051554]|uniref:prenyltransferase/squalene oxidase repeat-containing protein n=1 Tax=Streptomyces sp. NPDC051554 TaxID=3365656 RepID=UPI0037B46213